MKFSEIQLRRYAASLDETEHQKCKDAIAMAGDVLKELNFAEDEKGLTLLYEDTLAYGMEMRCRTDSRKVRIFVCGSYANDTNVGARSGIDIAVVEEEGFPARQPGAKTFREDVEACLREKFGSNVERKGKSLLVHGELGCINIMVGRRVLEDRRGLSGIGNVPADGLVFYGEDGEKRVYFPERHIANGRTKEAETNRNYRRMVRIMKEMRVLMEEQNCPSAREISSFELESLLWNLPDALFKRYCFCRYSFDDIVEYLYRNDNLLADYKEANGVRPLCPEYRNRNRLQDFIYDLRKFYEYGLTED